MKIVMNQVHSTNKETGTVYMTKDISPEGLIRTYRALGMKAVGKRR